MLFTAHNSLPLKFNNSLTLQFNVSLPSQPNIVYIQMIFHRYELKFASEVIFLVIN